MSWSCTTNPECYGSFLTIFTGKTSQKAYGQYLHRFEVIYNMTLDLKSVLAQCALLSQSFRLDPQAMLICYKIKILSALSYSLKGVTQCKVVAET